MSTLPTLADYLPRSARALLPSIESRRRKRFSLLDDDTPEFQQSLSDAIRDMPAESADDQPAGGLQRVLDIIDLPRNAIANLVNYATGSHAQPLSKRKGVFGLPQISAGDLLKAAGLTAGESTGGKVVDFLADFLGNVALDPLTYATFGTGSLAGSAGRKIGQHVFTEAGEKAVARGVKELQTTVGRKAFERVLAQSADREAARAAAAEAVNAAKRGFSRVPGVQEAAPTNALRAAYETEQGGDAVRRMIADRVAAAQPELLDTNAIGLTTRGVKEFNPLDIPLVVGGGALQGAASLFSPRTAEAIGQGVEAVRNFTRPILNPASFLLPDFSKTLLTREAAGKLAEKTGLSAVTRAVGRIPGAQQIGEGVRTFGREVARRFTTEPLPPRPGDAQDAVRYEAEQFERFAKRNIARRLRQTAWDERRRFNALAKAVQDQTGMDRDLTRAVLFHLGESHPSDITDVQLRDSVRQLVRNLSGTDEQADKLFDAANKASAEATPNVARAAPRPENATPNVAAATPNVARPAEPPGQSDITAPPKTSTPTQSSAPFPPRIGQLDPTKPEWPVDLSPVERRIGDEIEIKDAQQNLYSGQLQLVDLDELKTSHLPQVTQQGVIDVLPDHEYPHERFQMRDRGSPQSVAQIRGIAETPEYKAFTNFGLAAAEGPPVTWIDDQGRELVIQGNGRVAGMRAWKPEQWEQYKSELSKTIGDIPAGFKKPVLIRRLLAPQADAEKLAVLGQTIDTLKPGLMEEARAAMMRLGVDRESRIPPIIAREPITRDNVGPFLAQNRPFQEWMLHGLNDQKRQELLNDPDELARQVNLLFLGTLPPNVQRVIGTADAHVQDALSGVAPLAATARTLIQQGRIKPDYDLSAALESGVQMFAQARAGKTYGQIMDDIEALSQTPTFEGLDDVFSGSDAVGAAMGMALIKASRLRNPALSMAEGAQDFLRRALDDAPDQLRMFADDAPDPARTLFEAFFGPERGPQLYQRIETIRQRASAKRDALRAAAAANPPLSSRAEFREDVRNWTGRAGWNPQDTERVLGVIDRFSDDALRGLRLQDGDPEESRRIIETLGRKPAAAYYYADTISPEERAALGAKGIIRIFERSPEYPDTSLLFEELGHHLHRNVATDADRDLIDAWYASKSPEQWADTLRARSISPQLADYYAGDAGELFSRYFADYVMGREVEADPGMRSLWQRLLDSVRDIWRQLTGRGELGIDSRIEHVISKHYDAPLAPGAALEPNPSAATLPGAQGALFTPPEPRAPAPGVSGVAPGSPQLMLRRPRAMEFAGPVRDVMDMLESRADWRVSQEQAAGVPAAALRTEQNFGYMMRFLSGSADSAMGRLMRRGSLKVRSSTQIAREEGLRDMFAAEINRLIDPITPAAKKARAAGSELPTYEMNAELSHVARELESTKLIGSAEFLGEAVRRFGVSNKAPRIPAGFVPVRTNRFGAITEGYLFPAEVARVLEKHAGQWDEPSKMLDWYRQALGVWKGLALVSPAYHLRNMFGNVWNASLFNAWSPSAFADAVKLQRSIAGGEGLSEVVKGTPFTREALYRRLYVDAGVVGGGFFGTEARVSAERVRDLIDALDHPTQPSEAWRQLKAGKPLAANMAVGHVLEEGSRIAMIIERLRRGDTLPQAVDTMKKALLDYSDLTPFERGTATTPGIRDIIPFYAWTRKNAGLMLQIALTDPKKLAVVPKVQLSLENALAGQDQLPPSLRPAHILKEGGVQLSGGENPRFANLGYMLPIGELRYLDPNLQRNAAGVLDQVAGPLKTVGELATNQDTFFNRPIRDYPGQTKEFLGIDVPPEAKHVLRSIRPLNTVEQIRQFAGDVPTAASIAGALGTAATGFRAFAVDPARQVFEQERRVNDQLGAIRRDMRRRLTTLSDQGADPAGDDELRRLLQLHEQTLAQRDRLPVKAARGIATPMSRRRRKMLEQYIAENAQR